jgi:GTPase SAR1 family protein
MPDSSTLRRIKIFISSPSDVKEECDAALQVIRNLEGMSHIEGRLSLKGYRYERETPAAVGKPAQETVDEYMLEADKADIFVCILWKRMGSPYLDSATGEKYNSGTEYEFRKAYAANQKSGRPQILLYRSMKSHPPDVDPNQLKLVQEFFQRFHGETPEYKGLPTPFGSRKQFRALLLQDLDDILSRHFLPRNETVVSISERRHDFYRHVTLPANYIERRGLITELRDIVIGSRSCCIAFHAMGGAGKSVLARALCDDEGIQSAFPDGILWASLGKKPDIIARLREWITELRGTISENAPTENSLKNNLGELLKERTCLLIVDDVWNQGHAEPFRVGGGNCRLLMTTRDAEAVRPLGAEIHPIPMLSQQEAIELLEAWGGDTVKRFEFIRKIEIVKRLGRHPLAIKLAGAQLQQKPFDDWFKNFEVGRLKLGRPDPNDPHASLMATFNLSVEDLSARDRRLYHSLGIFKEDEDIPQLAIARLWKGLENLGGEETGELVEDLASRALLELITRDGVRVVVIHDLLREFSENQLGKDGIRKAH